MNKVMKLEILLKKQVREWKIRGDAKRTRKIMSALRLEAFSESVHFEENIWIFF